VFFISLSLKVSERGIESMLSLGVSWFFLFILKRLSMCMFLFLEPEISVVFSTGNALLLVFLSSHPVKLRNNNVRKRVLSLRTPYL